MFDWLKKGTKKAVIGLALIGALNSSIANADKTIWDRYVTQTYQQVLLSAERLDRSINRGEKVKFNQDKNDFFRHVSLFCNQLIRQAEDEKDKNKAIILFGDIKRGVNSILKLVAVEENLADAI